MTTTFESVIFSSGRKARPISGWTPITEKYSGVTHIPWIGSARSDSMRKLNDHEYAATASNDFACRCHSSHCEAAHGRSACVIRPSSAADWTRTSLSGSS
ncbi:MAG: hypothetical protein R2748_23795 [Bryobacterales bacterium]